MTGQVRLLSQKMLYEQIAWQTRGTVDVDSEIRVIPETRVSDRLLAMRGIVTPPASDWFSTCDGRQRDDRPRTGCAGGRDRSFAIVAGYGCR